MNAETMLVLESEDPEPPRLELETDLSVVHLTGDDMVVMAGDDAISISVKDRLFRVSAASFFQVNTGMAGKMVEYLLDHLPVSSMTTLLDVYCGVGLFSAFFAASCRALDRDRGIPISLSRISRPTWTNLTMWSFTRLLQRLCCPSWMSLPILPSWTHRAPAWTKRALEALLALGPARIAYVSCDPSTLGRDITLLTAGGYRLIQVTPFDLFPQTYSIESISLFDKEPDPGNHRD